MKHHTPQLVALCFSSLCPCVFSQDKPQQTPENYGPEKVRATLAKMTGADCRSVSLFTAEPMVQNLTSFDVDANGRISLTKAANDRKSANPPTAPSATGL